MRNKKIILLLAVLSAAAGFIALAIVRHHYAAGVAARVWPTHGFEPPFADAAEPQTNTVLLLGDSRIAQWGKPEVPGWRVLNAGVSGETSGELAMSCRKVLEQTRPQMVVIEVGINDIKLLGVCPEMEEIVVAGCVSNVVATVAECRRVGARVVVSPVWPPGRLTLGRRVVWSGAVRPAVEDANGRLARELAGLDGASVVDLFGVFCEGKTGEATYPLYRDTMHLGPVCYTRLTTWLAGAVRAGVTH